MKRYLLPLALVLLLTFTLVGYSADWLTGYRQRIELTTDETKIDTANLEWFSVTVYLTGAQAEEVFAEFDADEDYNKVCFTKADGVTVLFAECELFDVSEETAIFHVSTKGWELAHDVDTDFYMYYDDDHTEAWEKKGIVINPVGDNDTAVEPTIIYEGNAQVIETEEDVFKMWYREGENGVSMEISYAESTDGEIWVAYDTNPVHNVEDPWCPFVFKDGATYYMYVHSDWDNIDKYSSADGLEWAKDKDNAFSVGAEGQWDDDFMGNVFVWKEGANDWRMLYEARSSSFTPFEIGYATSEDGETWSRDGGNPVFSRADLGVSHPEVHKIGSTYYMFYHYVHSAYHDEYPFLLPTEIGLAISTNLTDWTEYGGNPIFFRTESYEGVDDTWGQVSDMCCVEVGGETYMWYSAVPDQTPTTSPDVATIALAKSSLSLSELVLNPNLNHTGSIGSAAARFVWDDKYKIVTHMVDDTTSTILDSTINKNDGTKKAANEPVEAVGLIGKGQDFEPTDDEISLPTLSDVANFTVELLMYPHLVGDGSGEHPVYSFENYDDTPREALIIKAAAANSNFDAHIDGTGEGEQKYGFTINTWAYVAAIRNGTSIDFYKDGVDLEKTLTVGAGTVVFNNHRIGGHYYLDEEKEWFDGIVDEVRISSTIRSVPWLKATSNSLYDTLLAYGSEETPTGITWNGIVITKWNGITITTPLNTQ